MYLESTVGADQSDYLSRAFESMAVVSREGARTEGFAGGMLSSRLFVAFTPAEHEGGFVLHLPGDDPIPLDPGATPAPAAPVAQAPPGEPSGPVPATATPQTAQPAPSAPACVPGQQVSCACADGGSGAQVCFDDGRRFGPCQCAAPAISPPPQPDEPLPPIAAPPVAELGVGGAPAARTGFQLAFRFGATIPQGRIADSFRYPQMTDNFGAQVYLLHVDVGWKVVRHLFLGAYVGMGMGGAGGALADACDAAGGSCMTISGRFGGQIAYHILPDRFVNPWVGFGFGFDFANLSVLREDGDTARSDVIGMEFADLMAGVDLRFSKGFGLGLFVSWAAGIYFSTSTDEAGVEVSQDISDTAVHEWLTLGARIVINP